MIDIKNIVTNFDWSGKSLLKIVGLVLGAVILLTIVLSLLGFAFRTAFFGSSYDDKAGYYAQDANYATSPESIKLAPPQIEGGYDRGIGGGGIMPPIVPPAYIGGDDAEDFEAREHYATIRTALFEKTCQSVEDLKERADVIFENANKGDRNCNYRFKVSRENEAEMLDFVDGLNPDDFRTQTYTIKRMIEMYDDEATILEKKLALMEKTLISAQNSYAEVERLATNRQNVDALAKIIDSRIKLVDRLSSERLNIMNRLANIQRIQTEQTDRTKYTYFNINISKNVIFDAKALGDSWTNEAKQFVREVNSVLQDISINLVAFLLRVMQAAIYFFIAIVLLRFGWIATKYLWRRIGRQN